MIIIIITCRLVAVAVVDSTIIMGECERERRGRNEDQKCLCHASAYELQVAESGESMNRRSDNYIYPFIYTHKSKEIISPQVHIIILVQCYDSSEHVDLMLRLND